MQRFTYKAKDQAGKEIKGEVEANDEHHAAKLIKGKNLFVVSLKSKSSMASLNFSSNRVAGGEIANFTRQLATMINAGLPLTEALLILRSQSKGSLQHITAQVLADVEEGESLSRAMSKHEVFSKTYIALIHSGEISGVLDQVLVRLADNLEKQQEFKGKIKNAMIYPIIIVVAMIGVSLVMMIFVIPKLTELYDQFDAELPITTRFLITVSGFLRSFWHFIIAGFILLVYLLRLYKRSEKGGRKFDELILKVPIIGELQRQIVLTEITRTLSLMVGSGVSIIEGLSITAKVVGNRIISDALEDSVSMVEKGFPVAFAFSKHPESFPFILSQMVAVGEETGKMDEVLQKVSHVFEVESDQKVKALSSAVEPMILIILGLGVAFIVVSIVLPIYNLTSAL
ncbi:type II secretion system F family protein [Candidatus Woesebacteria bacterium]|nr:type II secretion system F family protein [Candidatus Woesebacteria bacterium]